MSDNRLLALTGSIIMKALATCGQNLFSEAAKGALRRARKIASTCAVSQLVEGQCVQLVVKPK